MEMRELFTIVAVLLADIFYLLQNLKSNLDVLIRSVQALDEEAANVLTREQNTFRLIAFLFFPFFFIAFLFLRFA